MYPDPITPRAHPDLLARVDYDPFSVMPGDLPASPRVFTTAAQIERARQRQAEGIPVDVHGFNRLIASCRLDEPLPPFTDDGGPPDWGGPLLPWLQLAFRNALAALLTGDERHRRRALEAMHQAAEATARVAVWTGHEHNEAEAAARAYDLLAATGLDPADDNVLRGMLWTFMHALDQAGHRACNNHNAMNMVGRLSIAAALGHRQWIHDAFYGCVSGGIWRYGMIHTLRHDFLADGMQWEGAIGYHRLVVEKVCECFSIMDHLGVNLWHREWPSTLKDEGFDEHRGWGPKGNKPTTAIFDLMLYQAFANGDYSLLHDSGLRNLRDTWRWWRTFNKAWEVYGYPRYAWALTMINGGVRPQTNGPIPVWFDGEHGSLEFVRIESRDIPEAEHPFREDRNFALCGRHINGCSLFPVHGSAVLRGNPTDTRALGAYLYWGPHWAGHRSPAALHLDLHAFGRPITLCPHVASGYSDDRHLTWNRTTIAHNTVSVDETPMFPYDFEGESIWEYDLWRDSNSDGHLIAFQPEANFRAVRAANDNVYPGVQLDRTVIITEDYLLDVYRVEADRERQLDWSMHCARDTDFDIDEGEPVDLGQRRGYVHFTDTIRHPQTGGWIHLPARIGDAPGAVTLWLDGAPGTHLILACDPVPKKTRFEDPGTINPSRSTLLLRTRASSTLFVALWTFNGTRRDASVTHRSPEGNLTIDVRDTMTSTRWHLPRHDNVTVEQQS